MALLDPSAARCPEETPRKRYERPVLQHLGNVRGVTLGCTGGLLELGLRRLNQLPNC